MYQADPVKDDVQQSFFLAETLKVRKMCTFLRNVLFFCIKCFPWVSNQSMGIWVSIRNNTGPTLSHWYLYLYERASLLLSFGFKKIVLPESFQVRVL